jgi:aminopeptidase N
MEMTHRNRSKRLILIVTAAALCPAAASAQPPPDGPRYGSVVAGNIDAVPHGFDALHYNLNLTIPLTNDSLSGLNRITIRLDAPATTVSFNAVGLRIDTARVDGTVRPVTIDSAGEEIAVDLGTARSAGDTITIDLVYSRVRVFPRYSRYGYYFFDTSVGVPANLGYTMSEPSDARNWMPCYDEPWDKATAEFHLTVPAGYVAASNGRLTGVAGNGDGTVTWNWQEDHQIAPYLMCFTASKFSVSSLDYVRAAGDTVPVQYYVWQADSAACAAYLTTVRSMVQYFETVFGPYPFDKYGMTAITPFSYGGMEHQSLTTLNRYLKTDETVVSHELSHQWWGDLVTCGTWPDIWLNEGFASYAEALWQEHRRGHPALTDYMLQDLTSFQYASWQGSVYDPQGQGFFLFDQVVYSKAAWVLHMLRSVVGDSTFFHSLRAYREKFSWGNAVTTDFTSVVDSVSGMDLSWFFDEWIFGAGWPKYSIAWTPNGDSTDVTISQQQAAQWPTFTMPLTVRVYSGGSKTDIQVRDTARTQLFRLATPFPVDSVALDPDSHVLKQMVPTPTEVRADGHPVTFALSQNYPNPFNPSTTISYTLPVRVHARLTVYDVLGRRVAVLVDGVEHAGEHTVLFDATRCASGVYIYRLEAGTFTADGKMTLTK